MKHSSTISDKEYSNYTMASKTVFVSHELRSITCVTHWRPHTIPIHSHDTLRPQKGTQPCISMGPSFFVFVFVFKYRTEDYAFTYTRITFQTISSFKFRNQKTDQKLKRFKYQHVCPKREACLPIDAIHEVVTGYLLQETSLCWGRKWGFFSQENILGHSMRQDSTGLYQVTTKCEIMELPLTKRKVIFWAPDHRCLQTKGNCLDHDSQAQSSPTQ